MIERKGLAGFAAPFDSYLGVAVHDKLGNSHSLLYSQSGRFGGKSTGVLPGGPGLCSANRLLCETEIKALAQSRPAGRRVTGTELDDVAFLCRCEDSSQWR